MIEIELVIILISTIGTAVWTVLTWTEQQEKEKRAEQDQIDALYINPFLLAAEELQALLYSILAEGEIEFFRRDISSDDDKEDEISYHEALEIVYVIIKYFGWAWYVYRYGSYTQDKTAIELTRNISETFADRLKFGPNAFRFTFTKQRSLGQMFVKRLMATNASYPEFKATTLYQFDQEMIESKNKNDPLYQDLHKTIEAIRCSRSVDDLEGRERLIQVQNQLVDLSNYIESKEGFSLSSKKRKKTKLVGNTIKVYSVDWLSTFNLSQLGSNSSLDKATPQIIHKTRGRIRLRIPQLFDDEIYSEQLQSLLQSLIGVKSIQVNQKAASITIYYNDQSGEFESRLLATIAQSTQNTDSA